MVGCRKENVPFVASSSAAVPNRHTAFERGTFTSPYRHHEKWRPLLQPKAGCLYLLKVINNKCHVKLNVFLVNIVFQIISAKCFKTGQYNSICTCVVVICSQAITYGIQVPFASFYGLITVIYFKSPVRKQFCYLNQGGRSRGGRGGLGPPLFWGPCPLIFLTVKLVPLWSEIKVLIFMW